MSVSRSEGLTIKTFLEQQFISTSLEWIEACIEFIKQEHNQNSTLQNLKNLVYQQWLTADLEEIGVSCLPPELPTTQKTTLNGSFALQVDGIRDISRPAYAQIKEMNNITNSNADFSATPASTIPSWEAKPTRMLMLNLTDGCSHIQGMEYRSITSLSPNLPPGVKVLIQGPVDCRFGVLMLTSEKIKVLGGEVESKLEQFSRKAILRELLQLPAEVDNDGASADPALSNTNSADVGLNSFLSNTSSAPTQNNYSQQVETTRNPNSSNSINQRQKRNSTQVTLNSYGIHQQNSNRNVQRITALSERQNMFADSTNRHDNLGDLDNLDVFENEEDDFAQGLDYNVLDEIEKESLSKSASFEAPAEDENVWQEDEEMIQEMMAFQEEDPGFKMPFDDIKDGGKPRHASSLDVEKKPCFTDLSSVLKQTPTNCIVTIKGFIMKVLSKLECTKDDGWSLLVKISDNTASLDVQMHDKVLEEIMGISASEMVKMKLDAATDPEKGKEVLKAISRFKSKLKDYNCIMEVKFLPNLKPYIVKCYPMNQLNTHQLAGAKSS